MKNCVVTGGARGIGKEIVTMFAAAGCRVVFIDRDREAALRTQEELQAENRNVQAFVGDIGNEADVKEFADYVIEKCGKVNALINNACYNIASDHKRRNTISKSSVDHEISCISDYC